MANTSIQLKKSGYSGNTPLSLQHGEVALNYADGKLYYKDDADSIQYINNQDSFSTINIGGSYVLATSPTDILTIVPSTGINITPDNASKKLTLSVNESGLTSFVKKSGDTMTGDLNLPTANLDANYIIVESTLYSGLASRAATPLPNLIAQFTSNSSLYTQVNSQNIEGDGSADFVITADIGDDANYYTDVGMGGSTYNYYTGLDTPFEPLTGYFLVQGSVTEQPGGNMIIGTTSPSTNVRFLVGGYETPNVVMSLEPDEVSVKKDFSVVGSITGPTITSMQGYTQSAFNKANTAQITHTSSNTAPTSPKHGDEWYKINEDILYVYSTDGTSDFWLDLTSAAIKTNDGEMLDSFARSTANGAYTTANSAITISQNGYNQANTGTTLAQNGYNQANTGTTLAQSAYNSSNTKLSLSGGTITGQLNIAFTPATTTNVAVYIEAANTIGGTGYGDFIKFTNTSGGATLPNKTIRMNNLGSIEIIDSNYGNNIFTLADGGDLTLKGNLITSNRPGFRVYGGGTTNINATNTLTNSNFVVEYNQGSHLNASTGIFTAPISGLYQVNLIARFSGSASISAIQVQKTTGGITSTQVYIEWAGNSTAYHMGGSSVVKMTAGDTLKTVVTAGTVTFDANDCWSVAFLG